MLDEQLVALLEARPERRGEQAAPELAGELHLRVVEVGVVERPEARQVERAAGTRGSEPPFNLDRSRFNARLRGENRLEPADESGHVARRRIDVMLADDVQGAVGLERPEVPVGSVGQDPDVPLLEQVAASLHVARELLEARVPLAPDPQILLELEDGQPALDVDASTRTVRGRYLAPDDAVVVQVESAVAK